MDNNKNYDYRKTKAGIFRFNNKELYLETVEFQKMLAGEGIAWHNPFSDECTSDFCCCEGGGNYHTYFPSLQKVVGEVFNIKFNGTFYNHPRTNSYRNKVDVITELVSYSKTIVPESESTTPIKEGGVK